MPTKLSCDANGTLLGFSYHDGYLDGVLTGEKEAHFGLRSIQGERRILTLRGVVALQVQDFLEGNIVLSLALLRAEQVAKDAFVQRALLERLHFDPAKLGPELRVFTLDSSYGADVIAVCGSVEVSEPGRALAVEG